MSSHCNKKVLLISYHFYPDSAVGARRPTEFARSLAKAGFEVDLLTVKGKETRNLDFVSNLYEVVELKDPINWIWRKLKKVKSTSGASQAVGAKNSVKTESLMTDEEKYAVGNREEPLKQRLKRYVLTWQALFSAQKLWILFCLFQLLWLRVKGNKYDFILSSAPPFSVAVIALAAKKLFSARWICDFRDPLIQWEDVYPGCISQYRVWLEERLDRKFLSVSDHVIVTTPSFYFELEERLKLDSGKVEKLALVYNGFDGGLKSVLAKDKSLFRIVHAGSLYMNRNPMPFLEAVREIKNAGGELAEKLIVDFYGDCRKWGGVDLVDWITENKLEEVVLLHGKISVDALGEIYQQADILLAFAQKQQKQIPAKIFEYIPYDGTVLAITESDSDTAKLLNNDIGKAVDDSVDEIYDLLVNLYVSRKSVPSSSKEVFSRGFQNKKLINLCNVG